MASRPHVQWRGAPVCVRLGVFLLEDTVKFGLSTLTRGVFTTPEAYAAVANAAERAGFDFLSVSDHLVVPANFKSRYPYHAAGVFAAAEHGHCFDQLATVAFLAGCTDRLRLLTSVTVLPHRPAMLTAKIACHHRRARQRSTDHW